jgi:hypothetical protein
MLSGGDLRFRDDDGSADPRAAAALAAFAAGEGSEHDALTALACSRLLVPVVASLSDDAGPHGAQPHGAQPHGAQPHGVQPHGVRQHATGEKGSEMSLPTLVGRDGRRAVPAFTCLEALARWRPDARPVPALASLVWPAAIADACAVVVDVAGPVPLAIEGARLAALADGQPVPLPHEDPDVLSAVRASAAGQAAISGLCVAAGQAEADVEIRVTLAPGCAPATASEAVRLLGTAVMARLGGRLRRGIAIAVAEGSGGVVPPGQYMPR